MAEGPVPRRLIRTQGISGEEICCPKGIWTPAEYRGLEHFNIPFTKVQKAVTEDNKIIIVGDGNNVQFKGNKKQYDSNINARFSWFSVFINDETLAEIAEKRGPQQERGDLFLPGRSRYGTEVFTVDFDKIIQEYETCCNGKARISILGTYVYRREVMHAYVIAPEGFFGDHPRVATRTDDGIFTWNDNLQDRETILTSPEQGRYNWKTFSTIAWDGSCEGNSRYKKWGHLTFAFYLDCLPNETLVIPNDIGSWGKCNESKPFLGTVFQPDADDPSSDDDV
ncbi:uncharacterized protein LOC128557758 [Mercenaria mercenaria]|uniref:uncharacterized protein LOC128557758 n=1 Tax=Mercenaria mercenaria TaxID=6596 RepID=UPI00234F7564|nr:uncharacterized protein LOC128557758 [Mercenaria mercenaria]